LRGRRDRRRCRPGGLLVLCGDGWVGESTYVLAGFEVYWGGSDAGEERRREGEDGCVLHADLDALDCERE
jgi:hypothetical protein